MTKERGYKNKDIFSPSINIFFRLPHTFPVYLSRNSFRNYMMCKKLLTLKITLYRLAEMISLAKKLYNREDEVGKFDGTLQQNTSDKEGFHSC